ncbi:NUDIX domain-containing protein [Paradevosia shaoguanensis]|uniref:NUDIX domain-containing protein n=1 Tax=Paradevosia shaoguanensis TaxID=1335043 RepID=A0AA41QM11_9HYPH|nr:NUDIX domain-containing protein [Paradevosia shaoguanensis]MCF1742586.1 NUDIX domain-containing protein [Paradevosia shaoguanensis]MCI0127069.1 NUDIX domain-containing protein [Paradevosia shaoguanensis]
MTSFADSYLGQLRALVGSRELLVPGTRIVIENEAGYILLDFRPDFLRWALPGGACEPSERVEETIVREVLEESGLVITDVKPIGFASDPAWETTTFPNGDVCRNFAMIFTTRAFEGEPVPRDGEALEYRWFDPHDLPDMVANHRRSVDAWLRWKAGGSFQLT